MTTSPASGSVTTAWSVDGITFGYRGPVTSGLRLGGYVALSAADGQRLGIVLSQEVVDDGSGLSVQGSGRLLGPQGGPVDASPIEPAPSVLVRGVVTGARAPLEVGALATDPSVPAVLDARGFNRHTFLCGQSGSGKTYALGVILERLVLRTRLPLLVLDPNGDHVHLGTTAAGVEEATARAYATAAEGVRVLGAVAGPTSAALRIRARELGVAGIAALLRLDPIGDRDEYNALVHLLRDADRAGFRTIDDVLGALRASGDGVVDPIRKRLENLGVDAMPVWSAQTAPTVADVWADDRPRALVADTSGFEQRRDRVAVAVAVLQQLWARRTERRALLLVVDEAHDVCPAEPTDPLQRLAVELFTRVAGEGRKYGIHLLLASQRPDKLPANVLSQCDNLALMRVNSAGDRAALAARFGFAPAGLVELAGTFGLGETLLAGRFAPAPLLAKVGTRLTPEGGADVPTDWAVTAQESGASR